MTLLLRKVTTHINAPDAYRVVYGDVEVGSIGIQNGAGLSQFWAWGIDTVLPRLPFVTSGQCSSRDRAMENFKIAWGLLAEDPDRLASFLDGKSKAWKPK